MAQEKEVKQEEKKPIIEISVWFIICLIILIFSSLLVIKLNREKTELAADRDKYVQLYEETQERNNVLNERIRNITSELDDMSNNELRAKLNELLDGTPEVTPESGDVVTSGDVAE